MAARSARNLDGIVFAGPHGQVLDKTAPFHLRSPPGAITDFGIPGKRPSRGLVILPGPEFRWQRFLLRTRGLAETGVLGQIRQLTRLAKLCQLALTIEAGPAAAVPTDLGLVAVP